MLIRLGTTIRSTPCHDDRDINLIDSTQDHRDYYYLYYCLNIYIFIAIIILTIEHTVQILVPIIIIIIIIADDPCADDMIDSVC